MRREDLKQGQNMREDLKQGQNMREDLKQGQMKEDLKEGQNMKEDLKETNKEEIKQAMKYGLKRSIVDKLGSDSADKEKIAFLEGYNQGIVESYLPIGGGTEEMIEKRKSTIEMQQGVVIELIEEIKMSQY